MARELQRGGFRDVRVLEGGWRAWLELGARVQVPSGTLAEAPPPGPPPTPDEPGGERMRSQEAEP